MMYPNAGQSVPGYAARRFERKHSGLHQGVFVAVPLSILMWAALLVLFSV